MKFDFTGSSFSLYSKIKFRQPTSYAAFIDTGKESILSFSPELFFRINGRKIITRPMKGTIKRGLSFAQDKKLKDELRKGKKTQAENLMIVDLLRNDLGRISNKINVPKLFKVEKYPTLFQMTSTVEAKLKDNLKIKDIFSSLFPCGSVTGAPKIKTMEIIKELEKEPRGVYTGAIGYISPGREACFNVGIRTVRIKGKKGELGVGGGIVCDSKAEDEYEEALLKAEFFKEGIEKVLFSDRM
ncbi:MAG: anthranilate synthase component I family protein [Candidatus Omnitrophota bacterium]